MRKGIDILVVRAIEAGKVFFDKHVQASFFAYCLSAFHADIATGGPRRSGV